MNIFGKTKQHLLFAATLFAAFFFLANAVPAEEIKWQYLEEGLEIAELPLSKATNSTGVASVNVLRMDPEKVNFELLMASEQGSSLSLGQWAEKHKLIAAINASMYLPDAKTSTGYMRRGEHVNNSRIGGNFGAFFVAMPLYAEGPEDVDPENPSVTSAADVLPRAAVLDRNDDSWKDKLANYQIVVQNYRLMSPDGTPLWSETAAPYSIAAVGQDDSGHILFLHCAQPVTSYAFVKELMALPLKITRLMYVEGGYQAAMLVKTKKMSHVWLGKYSQFLEAGSQTPLPNILGVKRKGEPSKPARASTKPGDAPSNTVKAKVVPPKSEAALTNSTVPEGSATSHNGTLDVSGGATGTNSTK